CFDVSWLLLNMTRHQALNIHLRDFALYSILKTLHFSLYFKSRLDNIWPRTSSAHFSISFIDFNDCFLILSLQSCCTTVSVVPVCVIKKWNYSMTVRIGSRFEIVLKKERARGSDCFL